MIMNMAALLIVNDFDNIVGDYFVQKLEAEVSGSDDFMVFENIQPFMFYGVRNYQTITITCWILYYIGDFYQQNTICSDFDTFYEEEFVTRSGYSPTNDFQAIWILRRIIKYIFFVSIATPLINGLTMIYSYKKHPWIEIIEEVVPEP